MLQSAVCFEHIQVYENAKKIKDEILEYNADFPLFELRGFRNHLVHEYGNADYSIIYETSINDVPLLLSQLKKTICK